MAEELLRHTTYYKAWPSDYGPGTDGSLYCIDCQKQLGQVEPEWHRLMREENFPPPYREPWWLRLLRWVVK